MFPVPLIPEETTVSTWMYVVNSIELFINAVGIFIGLLAAKTITRHTLFHFNLRLLLNIVQRQNILQMKSSFDESWDVLQDGLGTIYDHKENIKPNVYMKLYDIVFGLCKAGTRNSKDVRVSNNGNALNEKLYMKIQAFVVERVEIVAKKLDGLRGTDLLGAYVELWKCYDFSSRVSNGIFPHLNDSWVYPPNYNGPKKNVYDTTIIAWKKYLFDNLYRDLTTALLCLIQKGRDGEQITTRLLCDVVSSYLEMGRVYLLDKYVEPNQTVYGSQHGVYKSCFELPFLDDTRDFYAKESAEFLQTHNIVEYMTTIEKRMQEEVERCKLCLSEISVEPLTKVLQEVLITGHLSLFEEEFGRLLKERRFEDLGRMYDLCASVEGACDPLHVVFQKDVVDKCFVATKIVSEAANVEPYQYIESILKIRDDFNDLVTQSFKRDLNFVRVLDRAFVDFVNTGEIVGETKHVLNMAELLARYCDRLLRKGQKNMEETVINRQMSGAITIYNYLYDKDVFMRYYSRLLARRLVCGLSADNEAELLMVTKLRETSGSEYVRTLHRMFTDADTSKEVTEEFKKDTLSKDCVDTSMMILTTGVWPMKADVTFELPPKLKYAMDKYVSFYQARHMCRRLKYVLRESRCEVITRCFKRKYIFVATLAQMSVLHLFNNSKSLNFAHIQEQLKMDRELVFSALYGIVKTGVLNVTEGELESYCAVLHLNEDFHDKKLKVDLTKYVVKSEVRKQTEQVQQETENDRQCAIQAAIVRVMKTRKTLKYSLLVNEVVSQLTSRFNPPVPDIKKAVESLIEREYVKRQEEKYDVITYVA